MAQTANVPIDGVFRLASHASYMGTEQRWSTSITGPENSPRDQIPRLVHRTARDLAKTLVAKTRAMANFAWRSGDVRRGLEQYERFITAEASRIVAPRSDRALLACALASIGDELPVHMAVEECLCCADKVERHGFRGEHILSLLAYVLASHRKRRERLLRPGRLVWFAYQRGQLERVTPKAWFPATPEEKWDATWLVAQVTSRLAGAGPGVWGTMPDSGCLPEQVVPRRAVAH